MPLHVFYTVVLILGLKVGNPLINKAQKKRLDAFNTKALRRIVGVQWYDYVKNG